MATKQNKTDYRNSPTAWFCVLETELNRSNFERASEAKRELERLGIFLRFEGSMAKKLAEAERAADVELASQELSNLLVGTT